MLREIMINEQKAVPAIYKAAAALKTGMGVVIDLATETADVPSAASSADIYLVDKERVPTGANAARVNFSDYEEEFNTVAKDELVKLHHYCAGEQFATDQFTGTIEVGEAVEVGTNGKWAKATAASVYVCADPAHMDAGHTLLRIIVKDTAVTNASNT